LSLNQSTIGYVLPAPGERRPASFSSVLSRMDRLVALDRSHIVEQGSHVSYCAKTATTPRSGGDSRAAS
jgi:hypothetical protein